MLPEHIEQLLKGKEFIYLIHVPSTGGMYLRKTAFKDEPKFQWFGKNLKLFQGIKSDNHPCGLKIPVILKGSRNHSQSYINDPLFLDPRSLVIATVRNPFDQYVSSYLINEDTPGEKVSSLSFKEFIDITCDDNFMPSLDFGESFYLSRKFLFYQLFNDLGKCTADIILRKEKLNEGLKILLDALSISHSLEGSSNNPPGEWGKARERRGVARNRDYKDFYDDETYEKVKNKRKREILAFGYNFEGGHDDRVFIDPSDIFYENHTDKFWVI